MRRATDYKEGEEGRYINIDKVMLRELEESGFHSSKYYFLNNVPVKRGRAGFMLMASAAETRKRKEPKVFPLAEKPIQIAE